MKILVASGNLEDRISIKEFLTSHGHKVLLATEGFSALDKLRVIKFDLLLTDTKMPCLNGPELIEDMKERKMKITVIGMSESREDKKYYDHFWCKDEQKTKLQKLISEVTAKPLK